VTHKSNYVLTDPQILDCAINAPFAFGRGNTGYIRISAVNSLSKSLLLILK